MSGWNRTKGALAAPFFCAALGAQPPGHRGFKRGRPSNPEGAGAQGRRGAGYASDRPASGGADIYRYIPASGGADISAGRPASGGADRRPGVAGLDGQTSRHRFIIPDIDRLNACRCATYAIE